ncbi:hypothetical protein CJ179_46970 [Rhodococcus sp. ACS1]|uniref:ABC transporter substrate-binding protein n=1 Tax=Rhodococcus sp. ACS1 TaxID=2028570 RepID=UPI000BB151E9|nr:extracellular solute-binding protein [Rhodococcus sp. ACS1]PBC35605.1 hypothetical protein CJ179_46970 [Rhodococcus sp. ACS1]
MKIRKTNAGLGALLALALTVLTACGSGDSEKAAVVNGSWEDVVAAGNSEGQVNLYTVAPSIQSDRVVAAFNQMYPNIKVNVTRGAGELPARVETEISAGTDGADVLIYSDPHFFNDIADNLLEINGPNVEGWKDANWQVKGKVIIPTTFPVTMLVWNTNIFPDGFKNWNDLLAPAVKGKLALKSDVTTSYAAMIDFMERELGPDYLKSLGQQDPKYYPSSIPMNQAIASGEVGVTDLSTPSIVKDLQNQGAPVASANPDPGQASAWAAGAIATSKRPNAARVFTDFLMSREGQTAINADGFGAAGRDGIEGSLDLAGWELFDSTVYAPEKIQEAKAKFDEYFGAA